MERSIRVSVADTAVTLDEFYGGPGLRTASFRSASACRCLYRCRWALPEVRNRTVLDDLRAAHGVVRDEPDAVSMETEKSDPLTFTLPPLRVMVSAGSEETSICAAFLPRGKLELFVGDTETRVRFHRVPFLRGNQDRDNIPSRPERGRLERNGDFFAARGDVQGCCGDRSLRDDLAVLFHIRQVPFATLFMLLKLKRFSMETVPLKRSRRSRRYCGTGA